MATEFTKIIQYDDDFVNYTFRSLTFTNWYTIFQKQHFIKIKVMYLLYSIQNFTVVLLLPYCCCCHIEQSPPTHTHTHTHTHTKQRLTADRIKCVFWLNSHKQQYQHVHLCMNVVFANNNGCMLSLFCLTFSHCHILKLNWPNRAN